MLFVGAYPGSPFLILVLVVVASSALRSKPGRSSDKKAHFVQSVSPGREWKRRMGRPHLDVAPHLDVCTADYFREARSGHAPPSSRHAKSNRIN